MILLLWLWPRWQGTGQFGGVSIGATQTGLYGPLTRPGHSVVCRGQYGLSQRSHMNDTSADLRSLLDRLKGAQHALIEDAARQPGLPSTAIIRKIAELENTIAANLIAASAVYR